MSIFKGTAEPKKIYMWVEVQPITTPGIYHNPESGLISLSSDGTTRYTIADKNLGATAVYNNGDTLSQDNCGNYYQRGNNYGFPFSGPVNKSTTRVSAANYGPGNYYSSDTFIYRSSSPYNWDKSNNKDLRGDETATNAARRGPCLEGFHIWSYAELLNLREVYKGITGEYWTVNTMKTYLLMARAGYRILNSGDVSYQGTKAIYRTSTPDTDADYSYGMMDNSGLKFTTVYRPNGGSIRPMKNEAVQPDDSWIVLYQ